MELKKMIKSERKKIAALYKLPFYIIEANEKFNPQIKRVKNGKVKINPRNKWGFHPKFGFIRTKDLFYRAKGLGNSSMLIFNINDDLEKTILSVERATDKKYIGSNFFFDIVINSHIFEFKQTEDVEKKKEIVLDIEKYKDVGISNIQLHNKKGMSDAEIKKAISLNRDIVELLDILKDIDSNELSASLYYKMHNKNNKFSQLKKKYNLEVEKTRTSISFNTNLYKKDRSVDIYTDASHVYYDNSVNYRGGIGIYSKNIIEYSETVLNKDLNINPDDVNSLYLETYAIIKAIDIAINKGIKDIVIKTDSLVAIKKLNDIFWTAENKPEYINNTVIYLFRLNIYKYITSENINTLTIEHVKGHSGIYGNEKADYLAKQAR